MSWRRGFRTDATQASTAEPPGGNFAHALTARHVQFIAIGGAIGAGLFLGSGIAISRAGPALLIAYGSAGMVIFLMSRALGELALFHPVAGAFGEYASQYLGRQMGFITGWSYWLIWILVGAAEITGIGMLMRYWYPGVPQWIPALVTVVALYTTNSMAVKSYGELEFWLALVKVTTIVGLLVGGVWILASGVAVSGQHIGISNLWLYGGFLPHGWHGVLDALPVALFGFGGIEIIGLTAAETARPEEALPRAVNGVAYRILIFYLGSLTMIMLLWPWNALDSSRSPFILVLERLGFPAAAGLINAVVITALVSSCNSGIFASSRMLHSLSISRRAPGWLRPLDADRVPSRSVTACSIVLLGGVGLNYLIPDRVLGFLMAGVSALLLWTWAVIMLCHLAYRRDVAKGRAEEVRFRLPVSPFSNWLVLIFIAVVALLLGINRETRVAYYSAATWIVVLLLADAGIVALRKRRGPQDGGIGLRE
jgi:L-asparagine transporter-like permease